MRRFLSARLPINSNSVKHFCRCCVVPYSLSNALHMVCLLRGNSTFGAFLIGLPARRKHHSIAFARPIVREFQRRLGRIGRPRRPLECHWVTGSVHTTPVDCTDAHPDTRRFPWMSDRRRLWSRCAHAQEAPCTRRCGSLRWLTQPLGAMKTMCQGLSKDCIGFPDDGRKSTRGQGKLI